MDDEAAGLGAGFDAWGLGAGDEAAGLGAGLDTAGDGFGVGEPLAAGFGFDLPNIF